MSKMGQNIIRRNRSEAMSKMGNQVVREAESRSLDNATEVERTREALMSCQACKAPTDTPHDPGCDFTGGMVEGATPKDYHDAPYGIGPVAAAWRDKPHRVLFDLKDEIIKLRAEAERTDLKARLLEGQRDALLAVCRKLDELDWCIGYELGGEENHKILDAAQTLARVALAEIEGDDS